MPTSVSLFIGCLNDVYYPRVGVAVTKILEHFGCQVDFLDAQTCCGTSLYQDGYPEQAADLARRFVGIFQHSAYIVTPSPRCCAMVREEYTRLLVDDPKWEEKMWQVAGRTYEFVEFLTTVLKVDLSKLSLPNRTAVTYHYACQMRSMGVADNSPRIIQRMENVEFRKLLDAEKCCGAGGGLPNLQAIISTAMRDEKMKNLEGSGANLSVCNEAICAMRLGNGKTPIKHIAELMAEAMGLNVDNF